MLFDYETLKLIWWLLIGVILMGFAIMDGHDMGVGTLLPFLGKNDTERRVMINTIAPHWDGNQVWFITAGGAIFAAWPFVYAIAFSGLYWAMLLLLCALFFRPVGFEYRSKLASSKWRNNWDWLIFFGSAVPALLFGVAFGNLFLGIPFTIDDTMRSYYTGTFFGLLHPFALLTGVISVLLLMLQGSTFLAHRTDAALQKRAKVVTLWAGVVMLVAFSLAGLWISQMNGFAVTSTVDTGGVINPFMKTVSTEKGAWLSNYHAHPVLWLIPALVYVCVLLAIVLQRANRTLSAFALMSLSCAAMILTAATALFPFVLPSSEKPQISLTLWDAASSAYTLNVMLWVALIFVPIILSYTSWSYFTMRGKITDKYIADNDKSLY